MNDALKYVFWIGLSVLGVGLVLLARVVIENVGSRNLSLAGAAPLAAVLLFAAQLPFELRQTSENAFLSSEFTIDREQLQIRQWNYPLLGTGFRINQKVAASDYVKANHPEYFKNQRDRLTSDLVLYSILCYLSTEQYDWQQTIMTFRGKSIGTERQSFGISSPKNSTSYSKDDLQSTLRRAGNLFTGSEMIIIGNRLRLPPKTIMKMNERELTIENPYCRFDISLVPSNSITYFKPSSGNEPIPVDVPKIANGDARYETRLTGIRITVSYSWIRVQSTAMDTYKTWTARIVNGLESWFEEHNS